MYAQQGQRVFVVKNEILLDGGGPRPKGRAKEEQKHRNEFNWHCAMIQRNDPNHKFFQHLYVLDDSMAVQLGRSLAGNTMLQMLRIVIGPTLTIEGVAALVNGIKNSKITYPAIQTLEEHDLPSEMAPLYVESMKNAENASLYFPVDDEHAAQIGPILNGNRKIIKVIMRLHGNLTTSGAEALCNGICGSKMKSLEVVITPEAAPPSSEALQVLYSGILRSRSMDELMAAEGVGDMSAFVAALPGFCQVGLKRMELSQPDIETLSNGLTQTFPASGRRQLDHLTLGLLQLTPEGAQTLATAIHDTKIFTLDLHVEPLSGATVQVMKTLFLQGIRGSETISIVTVTGVVGNIRAVAATIPHLPRLFKFAIQDVELTVPETKLLIQGVMRVSHLHTLALNRCNLGNEHMRVLASGLTLHPTLREVDLSQNLISNAGLEMMMMVEPRPKFEWNLAQNQFHGAIRLGGSPSAEPVYARFN